MWDQKQYQLSFSAKSTSYHVKKDAFNDHDWHRRQHGRWSKYLGLIKFQKWLSKHQKVFNWKADALQLPAVVVSTWGVLESGGINFSRSAELVTVEKCKYPWDRFILMQTQQGGKNQKKKDSFALLYKMSTPL